MKIEKTECSYQVTKCDLKFGEQITLDGELLISTSVIEKIREEIEAIDTVKVKLGDCMNIIKSPQRIKDEVLDIIDKYMGVSE